MNKIIFFFLGGFIFLFFSCKKEDEFVIKPKNERFELTVIVNEGGEVIPNGGYFMKGTVVEITAIPKNGYKFLKWEGSELEKTSISITMNSDTTIIAQFVYQPTIPFKESELPIFEITTQGQIQNEPKVSGFLKIYEKQTLVFEHKIGIEYRGSTSFRLSDKKSYGFETWNENDDDVNTSLLDFSVESDWILTGHVFSARDRRIYDPTLMKHYIGYELFRLMGNYASRCEFVEVKINGIYEGVYVFMEKLKRDKNRIDIKKLNPTENDPINITGGYILKIDKTSGGDVAPNKELSYYETNWGDDASYNQDISFRSSYGTDRNTLKFNAFGPPFHSNQYLETYFLYEYPKSKNISDQQKKYIQRYVHEFETALLNDDFSLSKRTYTNYIDVNSFVDFFILNELVGNIDAYRISTYMHKDLGGKLKMGPVWDLNIGYGDQRIPQNEWIINYNTYVPNDAWLVPFWWKRLL